MKLRASQWSHMAFSADVDTLIFGDVREAILRENQWRHLSKFARKEGSWGHQLVWFTPAPSTISSCVFILEWGCDPLRLWLCTAVFLYLYNFEGWAGAMKMFLLFRHMALPSWGLCSLAACHPTNHCQRNCVMPRSVWFVDREHRE